MSRVSLAFLFLAVCLMVAPYARADQNYLETPETRQLQAPPPSNTRDGRGDMFGVVSYSRSDSATVNGGGSVLLVSPNLDGGISVGYNVGEHFNLNVDAVAGPARYKDIFYVANASGSIVQRNGWLVRELINIELYPFKGPITPLVTGGIGWTETIFDSPNLAGMTPQHVHETDLTLAGGGGLRWDIGNHLSAKLLYRANWTQIKGFDDHLLFHTFYLMIGYRF